MATIYDLNTSITCMGREEFTALVIAIRTQRRLRPTKAIREKKAPAKCARAPRLKNPKQQDLFQLAQNMTPEQRAALAAKLMEEMNL